MCSSHAGIASEGMKKPEMKYSGSTIACSTGVAASTDLMNVEMA